ncbi:MAG: hypothetical protein ABH840_00340 [Nanoarchaeota archaeon]
MAKQSLESQVREALIERTADELYLQFSNDPTYKGRVTELLEELLNSMMKSISPDFEEDIGEEERKEMLEEYKAELLPQIKAQFDNPEQLRQMAHQQAQNRYKSLRQLKAELRPQFKQLREDDDMGIDETAFQGFEKSFEELFQYVRTNDEMLRRLTEIAENEGLEVASKKEAGYRVIREMLPTADDYRAYAAKGIESRRKFFQQAQGSLMADGEEGKFLGTMFGAMGDAIEKLSQTGEKVQADYLEKTIKEIYSQN